MSIKVVAKKLFDGFHRYILLSYLNAASGAKCMVISVVCLRTDYGMDNVVRRTEHTGVLLYYFSIFCHYLQKNRCLSRQT